MNGLRVGSLFSGYGGLERGVQEVLGGTVAWHSEIDPGACKILAHRYPDVPNLGDITTVDWSQVEPVRVLTLGFPCQDLSGAGLRKGLRPGTRSGLWTHAAYAIDQLRPELVVIENVRGLLSADAHHPAHREHFHPASGAVEPCPWCVGDRPSRPLRALGAVLGDLADLGYDASWQGLRASDVGAPHGRFRVFITAWPAPHPADDGREWGRPSRHGRDGSADHGDTAADTEGQRRGEGWAESARLVRGSDDVVGGASTTRDASSAAWGGSEPDDLASAAGSAAEPGEPASAVAWGDYEPAIRRWERVLGRGAPAPTELGAKGNARLSPAFVEFLMGLPAGWVTDVPGLSRNEQLKALGNGVVSQQCAAALRMMLPEVMAVAS